jgi:hypothetical protein
MNPETLPATGASTPIVSAQPAPAPTVVSITQTAPTPGLPKPAAPRAHKKQRMQKNNPAL